MRKHRVGVPWHDGFPRFRMAIGPLGKSQSRLNIPIARRLSLITRKPIDRTTTATELLPEPAADQVAMPQAFDPWLAKVIAVTREVWSVQAFVHEADRAEGIERVIAKRPDFTARCRVVADLISEVAPRLANPCEASAREYTALLQEPLFYAMPFLDAGVRAVLAAQLLAVREVVM